MQIWLVYTLLATLIYGIMNFIYKIAAEKNFDAPIIVFLASLTISVMSFSYILFTKKSFYNWKTIIYYSLLNGLFFGIANISKITALKKAPAAVVLPINKMNALFVIVIGLIWFNDRPTKLQTLGMLLSLIALYFLTKKNKKITQKIKMTGVFLALNAAILTALSMTVGKSASMNKNVDKIIYMFFSYSLVAVYSFILMNFTIKKDIIIKSLKNKKILIISIIIGFMNGIGYYIVLLAFSVGKISLIQSIFSNSILIPIILSFFVYKEKIPLMRIMAIILSIIAIILIKMG